ncbi:MAG: glutamine synthetase [Candidatus Saccharibacteria bacterium]|nr:glutamine synthetase [Pseudorhodobacter sp.]
MTDLVTFITTDYAGITRGRSMPVADLRPGAAQSTGWVPANMSLTPFDVIAEPNPWGSTGDLRLLGDEAARFRAHLPGAATPLDVMVCDITELDGTPWPLCPRGMLKAAVADLHRETGLQVSASFEHEFQLLGTGHAPAPAFSLRAMRQVDPFGPQLMAACQAAELQPETFLAEYGRDQFEVTLAPATPVQAADRAVMLREITRELARLQGYRASFAPKTALNGVGNGVHIHYSLSDATGPVSHDPAMPGGVSARMGAFTAGILRHMPALIAFTAPSQISGLRLQPHHWSSSHTWFGEADRESSLRICPVNRIAGRDPGKSFNIEYRPADACACPHLALALLIRAGLAGLRANLPVPPLFSGDPGLLSVHDRSALGLHRLPHTLTDALAALLADLVVCSWFDPRALATYLGMKRSEVVLAGPTPDDAMCQRYAAIY